MRKHLVSIVVMVLALAALAYAYFGDRGKVTDPEREQRAHLLFPAFRRDDMQFLELVHGDEKVRFEAGFDDAGDRAWKMTLPAGEKGDSVAIDRLLGALEYAAYERKVPSGGSGFESPRVHGTLSMKDVSYAFELGGDATTPEGAAYFRLEGEGVFVVKKDLVSELLKAADAYRDRSVVPYLSIDLSGLEIEGTESWAIERMDDVSFRIAAPAAKFVGIRVSRTALDKVWGAFAEMRAESFPPADEIKRHPSDAVITLTMTPKDLVNQSRASIHLMGPCSNAPDDIFFRRSLPSPLDACVPKGVLTGISTPLNDLADKHLFAAIPEEVEELVIESLAGGNARIEIARKGEGWHQRAAAGGGLTNDRDLTKEETELANAFVKTIVSSEGQILDPKPPPFSAAFRVKITRAGSHVLETVDLFNGMAHRVSDDAALELSPILFRRLQPHASAFRAPTIWPTSFEGAHVFRISTECASAKQVVVRDEAGKFKFQTPANFSVDSGNAIALAEAVERVRATSWVADSDDGTFGTTKGCAVSISADSRDAGERTAALWLGGDAGNDETFARANDDPAVFTVPRAFSDLAKTLLVDRSEFFVDADSIDAVDLSHAGKTKHFSLTQNVDAGADALVVAATIGELQADSALHLGPPAAAEGFASPTLDVSVHSATDGGAHTLRFVLGDAFARGDQKMIYARVDGVAATFLLPAARVRPLLDAVGVRAP
jgi:hypothetical protein